MNDNKKKNSLAAKFVIGFIIMGIAICTVTTARGYTQYKSYIQKQYNDTAYDIAEIFESYMSEEEIALYMKIAEGYFGGTVSNEELAAIKNSERYQEIERLLYALREATGANDIYMCYSDKEEISSYNEADATNWKPSTYIFDCYMDENLKFEFGHMGGFNPIYIKSVLDVLEKGERVDNYFISESEFGYNTSAVYPVFVNGEVKGVIGVEIPMSTLESALNKYVFQAIIATVGIVVLCIAVIMAYMYKNMISPINLIAREAEKFVDNNAAISDELNRIHTGDEIEQLSESVLQMEIDIKEYITNLTKVTAEKERISAELNVAKQIQADFLPSIFPAFPERKEFDIFATMEPAKEVGGDFYDFFMVDDNHLAFLVADVSGKGVPAALFMVIAKTLIKNHTQKGEQPNVVFEQVNDQLCENNKEGMFVTAWMGVLELSTNTLTYVNAGHTYPLLRRKGEDFKYLHCQSGFVLAGLEGMPYQQETIQLEKGDSIYLYSDGATEAINLKEELFGEDRLEQTINRYKDETPETILKSIKREMDIFVGEADQFDDITMLCLHYKG